MTMQFRHLPDDALTEGAISDDAVLALRRVIWPDGVVDAAEVEEILAIDDAVQHPSKAWIEFFVEAVTEFLLHTSEPHGYLSDVQADWLIVRLDRGAGITSPAKLELLVHLLEKLDGAPVRMNGYVLAQIERGVLAAGAITAEECALIRRVIFAPASYGAAHVGAEEAELLFRIKDATLGADNAPEWQRLFVQGVANYLQGWQGLAMPSAEQEATHERFLAGRNPGIGAVLGAMVRTSPTGLLSTLRGADFGRREHPVRDFVAEASADHAVTTGEQSWLDAHVNADGQIDALETALIAFLQDGD